MRDPNPRHGQNGYSGQRTPNLPGHPGDFRLQCRAQAGQTGAQRHGRRLLRRGRLGYRGLGGRRHGHRRRCRLCRRRDPDGAFFLFRPFAGGGFLAPTLFLGGLLGLFLAQPFLFCLRRRLVRLFHLLQAQLGLLLLDAQRFLPGTPGGFLLLVDGNALFFAPGEFGGHPRLGFLACPAGNLFAQRNLRRQLGFGFLPGTARGFFANPLQFLRMPQPDVFLGGHPFRGFTHAAGFGFLNQPFDLFPRLGRFALLGAQGLLELAAVFFGLLHLVFGLFARLGFRFHARGQFGFGFGAAPGFLRDLPFGFRAHLQRLLLAAGQFLLQLQPALLLGAETGFHGGPFLLLGLLAGGPLGGLAFPGLGLGIDAQDDFLARLAGFILAAAQFFG